MTRRHLVVTACAFAAGILVAAFVTLMGQPASEEAHHGATNWEAYVALLQSVPHVLLELTMEVVTAIAVYPLAKWLWGKAIRKHDAEHHPGEGH